MRMIRPKLVAPQITIAEEQHEYASVTAAVVRHPDFAAHLRAVQGDIIPANSVVLAFKPTTEERARIAAGDAIYVSLLTFLQPMQPIIVSVGEHETAAIYGVEVER